MLFKYTDEHIDFLRENIRMHPVNEAAALFNARFGLNITQTGIKGAVFRHGLKTGRTGCFEKHGVPFNKGVKGFNPSPATEFKKGHKPHNARPVGCEQKRGDGYWWVKVAEPNKWREKHVLLWEAVNDPVPKGFVILFADQDQDNVTVGNLRLVTRRELAMLNKNGYKKAHSDIKPSVLSLTRLQVAISARSQL